VNLNKSKISPCDLDALNNCKCNYCGEDFGKQRCDASVCCPKCKSLFNCRKTLPAPALKPRKRIKEEENENFNRRTSKTK